MRWACAAHLAVGDFSEGIDERELLVAFELVEVSHSLVDHLLYRLPQLTVSLREEGEVGVEKGELSLVPEEVDDAEQDAGGRGEVGGLCGLVKGATESSVGRRTLRVCFSSASSLSMASWILPSCRCVSSSCTTCAIAHLG
jgi:hypothetical protein